MYHDGTRGRTCGLVGEGAWQAIGDGQGRLGECGMRWGQMEKIIGTELPVELYSEDDDFKVVAVRKPPFALICTAGSSKMSRRSRPRTREHLNLGGHFSRADVCTWLYV